MKRLMMLFATTLLLGGLNAHQQMQSSTIHEAAAKGDLTSLCMFLSAGMPVDVLDGNGRSPFSIAIKNKQRAIVNFLIAREGKKDWSGKSALVNENSFYQAIRAGYIELINICLDAGVNVNSVIGSQSPLMLALQCEHKNKEVVKLLIARGANIATGDVLCAAAIAGNVELVKSCLDAGVDVNSVTEGESPLVAALKYKNKEVVELLIARGATIATGDVLCAAAGGGYIELVKMCLDKGVDVNSVTWSGSALVAALQCEHKEVVELLIARGATIATGDVLCAAAITGYIELVKMCLDAGVDVNSATKRESALVAALQCEHKNKEVVELLIAGGATIATGDVLWAAAYAGYIELVKACLDAGVDVNSVPVTRHWTPLVAALYHKHKEVVELLIARGATIATGDVLCAAAYAGYIELVKACLDKGLAVDGDGDYTPLMAAVSENQKEAIKFLITRGASLKAISKGCDTVLHAAANAGNVEIVKACLDAGIPANIKGRGLRPINEVFLDKEDKYRRVFTEDDEAIARLLIAHGASFCDMLLDDPERLIIDDDMKIAFCFMAKFGDTKAIRYLLAAGMPAGCTDAAGNTALSLARKAGNQEIVDLLTAYGATPLSAA